PETAAHSSPVGPCGGRVTCGRLDGGVVGIVAVPALHLDVLLVPVLADALVALFAVLPPQRVGVKGQVGHTSPLRREATDFLPPTDWGPASRRPASDEG